MFNTVYELFQDLRTYELRSMPKGAATVLSAGCHGSWYFDWFSQCYGPVKRHIGVEYYTPKPQELPSDVEWVVNTISDMHFVQQGEVDLLFAGQTIEHLWPDEVTGFLLEAHRVLRHRGWLVLDSPNRTVSARQLFSNTEHVVEFTVSEIRELLSLAGFDEINVRGQWLCIDGETGADLPVHDLDTTGPWPYLRRIAFARASPEHSFHWWAEAVRGSRTPDQTAIARRVGEIYGLAWPERVQRLHGYVGIWGEREGRRTKVAPPGTSGALVQGPGMPLRPGKYRVVFTLAVERADVDSDATVAECEVFLPSLDRALVSRKLIAADFPTPDLVDAALTFTLNAVEFGVHFRLSATGIARTEAVFAIGLEEEVLDVPRVGRNPDTVTQSNPSRASPAPVF